MKTPQALLIKIVFPLILIFLLPGCDSDDDNENPIGAGVSLSSPDLSSAMTMALDNSAVFNATIEGIDDTQNLAYVWFLATSRGTFIIDGQPTTGPVQTSQNSISVRGDDIGAETIKVEVINDDTEQILAEKSLSFEIVPASGLISCFDGPVLVLRDADWTRAIVLNLDSGTTSTINAPTESSFSDSDPTGAFYLRRDLTDPVDIEVYLESCDPSFESRLLVDQGQSEQPVFGPNGDYVYYSTIIDYPEQEEDPRAREIVRLDLETGEEVFITDTRFFSSNHKVSPDGEWIAFEQSESLFNPNGSFAGANVHLAVMPSAGGPAQLLVEIGWGDARLGGLDWSPDSEDIIFYIDEYTSNDGPLTEGIHRVQRTGGNPSLLYFNGDGSSVARNLAYYDNGNRIAFEDGGDIHSIDANGGDLQVLFDEGFVNLNYSWEP